MPCFQCGARQSDLRIAAVRILEARAQIGIARAGQYPNVSAGYSAVDERIPPEFGRPAVEANLHTVSASLGSSIPSDSRDPNTTGTSGVFGTAPTALSSSAKSTGSPPLVTVIASSCTSGEANANKMARASSMPGSVSRIIRLTA